MLKPPNWLPGAVYCPDWLTGTLCHLKLLVGSVFH